MKKIILPLCAALLMIAVPQPVSAEGISAEAAIIYEPVTGTVLFEKNADERRLVASTTKILTAMVVLENCALDEQVEISAEHAAVEGSSMYLKPGEIYTVEELLFGLMLASGNDAAAALADHTAGSMEAFADLMNEKCESLGLENSHFVNSHGLDAEGHFSSARDLALICGAAMENENFCRIFSAKSYSVNGQCYTNHNKLLSMYKDCIGGKTGYTDAAGRVLVSAAKRDGLSLICVTISDPCDWDDHISLYDSCFERYGFANICRDMKLFVVSGTAETVELSSCAEGLLYEKTGEVQVLYYLPRFVFAPVKGGDKAGRADVVCGGKLIGSYDIYFACSVSADKGQKNNIWDNMMKGHAGAPAFGIYYNAL